MSGMTTIGIDLAKSVFQLHGVNAEGRVLLRRQLRRSQMLDLFSFYRPAFSAWKPVPARTIAPMVRVPRNARELKQFGHEVRLMQPSCKPKQAAIALANRMARTAYA